jgi:hypothetical protein
VRLTSQGATRSISPQLFDDLQLRNTAPGGYAGAQCKLSRRIDMPHPELGAFTILDVIDTRTGDQVFFGRLDEPGRDSDGNVWSLSASGGSAHARDITSPVCYIDTSLSPWVDYEVTARQSSSTASKDADAAVVFTFPRGTVLATNTRVSIIDRALSDGGQHLALVRAGVVSGRTIASLTAQLVGRGGPAADAQLVSLGASTTAATFIAQLGSHFTTLHDDAELRMLWTGGAATVADDLTWIKLSNVAVVPTRVDRFGTELVASTHYPSTASSVLAWRIVEDVLGRFCPEWDRTASSVDANTTAVTQMNYADGATAEQVLDDMSVLVPSNYWAVWGGDPLIGPRFRWGAWPTTIGLELDSRVDPFASSGSASEVYNRVMVRWKDVLGVSRSVTLSGEAPVLTAAGIVRQGMLDLGSQIGNSTQATAAGQAWLLAHKYPTNSGSIKVRRPIADMSSGRILQPWELRAGVLARVRNIEPHVDYLNPAPNGETIFRVSEVTYSAANNEATLTLDSYGRTVARALANLRRSTERQRRV